MLNWPDCLMYEKAYRFLSVCTASRSEVELSDTMTFGTASWQSKTERKHNSRKSGRLRVGITIVSSSEIIAVVSLTGSVALGSGWCARLGLLKVWESLSRVGRVSDVAKAN